MEQVAAQDQKALEAERQRVDLETTQEREARRHIFHEVLSQERSDTDTALATERSSADTIIRHHGQVLAMVSHDLRNMVNAIGLKASLLSRSLPDAPPKWKKLA